MFSCNDVRTRPAEEQGALRFIPLKSFIPPFDLAERIAAMSRCSDRGIAAFRSTRVASWTTRTEQEEMRHA
jgi:hypothetical protein